MVSNGLWENIPRTGDFLTSQVLVILAPIPRKARKNQELDWWRVCVQGNHLWSPRDTAAVNAVNRVNTMNAVNGDGEVDGRKGWQCFLKTNCICLNTLYLSQIKVYWPHPAYISKLPWRPKKMPLLAPLELRCSTMFSLSLTIAKKGKFIFSCSGWSTWTPGCLICPLNSFHTDIGWPPKQLYFLQIRIYKPQICVYLQKG